MAYVDTDKLKRNIRVNLMPNVDIDGTVTVEKAERYFLNLIDKTPTADVVEVKHGEWDDSGRYKFADGSLAIRCTVCGCAIHSDEYGKYHWNYCPNCGAKMDGGKAE